MAEKDLSCAGCGKPIRKKYDGRPVTPQIELFPGVRVRLCEGRDGVRVEYDPEASTYYHGVARVSSPCLRAARDRIAACPGCGSSDERVAPGRICTGCWAAIARGREVGDRSEPLEWYALDLSAFVPYLSHSSGDDPENMRERLGRLLMRAVAGARHSESLPRGHHRWLPGGRGGHVGCPAAELTEAQAEALGAFLELLGPLFGLYTEKGEERGRSLLLQVLDGGLSPSQLDRSTAEAVERRAKLEAKLRPARKRKRA